MFRFLFLILKEIFGKPTPRRATRQPTLSVETELVERQPKKQHKQRGDSYGELLKKATALKRQGDMDGALLQIDRAISLASVGDRGRPQAQKKRIYYLLLDKQKKEALMTADQIIAEAPNEAQNRRAFVGTCYFFGYQQRARVLFSMKKFVESFLDHVRATWHWQDAMTVQERTHDEHTPKRAAETLHQEAMRCKIPIHDSGAFMEAAIDGLGDPNPESMVDRFRPLL